ncbi:hypothetical protein FJ656_20240 [Schumannella luteola]|nr:hypothetical protein FJ656_20240 [Schumannella luteola]
MEFDDASSSWVFTADGVVFTATIPTDDGPIVPRSVQAESQTGEFEVVDDRWLTVRVPTSEVHVDEATTALPDGSVADGFLPIGSPPVFPWSRDIVTGETEVTYGFTCSPSELVFTTSAPYGWHFVPGV